MTETQKTNYLLTFFGVGALFLAVRMESGLFAGQSERDIQLEELHRVTDAAQIWFVRPTIRGGGGDSFENVDFQRIGLTTEPEALEYQGRTGNYTILERSRERFILQMKDRRGQVIALDTLAFDTYPTLNIARR